MDFAALKEEVIAYSRSIGIDKIGFAETKPFDELKNHLLRQQELDYASGFEEPDIEKRVDPEKTFQQPRSIIAIALAYPSKLEGAPQSKRGERRGLFCRASWGEDYHHVLRRKLKQLETYLAERVPHARFRSMVDTGELSDRAVAERAGIGWSAKNCAIITEEFGSYVYLGEMITNLPFAPDEPMEDQCGDCTICIDACPTGALIEGGQLNAKRCIAYLTQTKDFLPDEFRSKLGNRLYGCDTCQLVCPKNKGKHTAHQIDFLPDPEKVKPLLEPLLTMSNRDFRDTYGTMAGSWRGKKPIQRNAILALAHYKAEEAEGTLVQVMQEDPRPVIRGTAAWALGKIGTETGKEEILFAKGRETDSSVLAEMDKGLAFYSK
ncbi:tRNA epoxyqueuosine(34) reductase QueG [Bacillus fonticola]|uniref:tRNA epoxyqueuosine(34) reductase QueG n=1 Tax=Bacillus fonticola TaxID=2728853 RepID=UPI001475B849|nr:tRNA epoxyqueuosine(34) reductase QueG [Bacillus fonticola]